MVRVLQVDVAADIGLGIGIEDGVFGASFVFAEDDAWYDEVYSELLEPGYSDGLGSLIGTMLGGLLPSDDLPNITLPYLLGAEISALAWTPSENGQWQSGNLILDTSGVEPVALSGCGVDALGCGDDGGSGVELDMDELFGCEDEAGCDGGCAIADSDAQNHRVRHARGRLIVLMVVFLGLGLRRRT